MRRSYRSLFGNRSLLRSRVATALRSGKSLMFRMKFFLILRRRTNLEVVEAKKERAHFVVFDETDNARLCLLPGAIFVDAKLRDAGC